MQTSPLSLLTFVVVALMSVAPPLWAGTTPSRSAPGEPPATDTGFLVSQIFAKVDADKLGGQVESRAPYSRFLEFGTVNMEARPFLFPALEMSKPRIRAIFGRIK